MVALAVPVDVIGQITVTGQVTVNRQPAISGSTILSGAVISTKRGSSAVVSLGKLGRVEVQSESTATLRFSDTGIVAVLDSGRLRVSNTPGVATSVATKAAAFIGDSGQANNYLVEVDCSCTFARVDTTAGLVTMREGSSHKREGSSDKQIVAETSGTAGTLSQKGCKPCLRPASAPTVTTAGFPLLILLAAGAAAAGIYFGARAEDSDIGGNAVVPGPTR